LSKKSIKKIYLVVLIALGLLINYGYDMFNNQRNIGGSSQPEMGNVEKQQPNKEAEALTVHFIDVGQADSILVKSPSGRTMLIDGGNNTDYDIIAGYLKKQGVSNIDILIGTHPHEDHIGALDGIIENFNIGKFYMPKAVSTTKTYRDVISAAKNKGITLGTAKNGVKLEFDKGISLNILSPISDKYEELNDYSAVIKLTYGDVSILFTGDAEKLVEDEIMNKGEDLSVQVIKIGHHGSNSSTGDKFLSAVNPKYAVISVGKDNDYGHPAQVTIDKLKNKGIKILRTDEKGTIVMSTDGKSITFNR